jgi:hypothetical protein
MMSRGFGYSVARSSGASRGISGTLGREGREECYAYSEVFVW